ncbi:hypothetical protein Poli38472_002410 [Pythium oligandrum]|uniref:Uncharacterized protein n=1 Tax=Pythium oligandrum TaxID=41045 RepID=A0A8K1CI34_PYTOL|nr:hypothetical protein Poli38472_002410 [Pythium oligandrum]|eukprot:TMW63469.1 hypothetical protein Poli38472_002410 [Pythium oligandrum]
MDETPSFDHHLYLNDGERGLFTEEQIIRDRQRVLLEKRERVAQVYKRAMRTLDLELQALDAALVQQSALDASAGHASKTEGSGLNAFERLVRSYKRPLFDGDLSFQRHELAFQPQSDHQATKKPKATNAEGSRILH